MQVIDAIQGTPEWLAHRATHFNASDAPAMLGCSPYMTRQQLLQQKKTGITPDIDGATQRRFDDGHRFEALARPIAEQIIGDDLYPVTGALGELSASFDGLTMNEDTAFEHKTLNTGLRAALVDLNSTAPKYRDEKVAEILPKVYRVQMEQQCMVSGATRVLFMASLWDNGLLVEEHHCWYTPDPALRAEIVAGWKQFAEDLATFVPASVADPAPVGKAPEALPALRIEVTGQVTASTLDNFKTVALNAIRSVNRDLKTDQDFADSAKARKWCEDIEERVAATKRHVLSQTVDIEAVFRTMDEISAEAREVRLSLQNLEKARTTARKQEILTEAQTALGDYLRALNKRLGRDLMPQVPADFAGAIAGKRSFSSMQDAVSAVLANAKIAASAIADKIDANLKTLAAVAPEHAALFPDTGTIALKAADDLAALVTARIAAHDAAVKKRADEEAEAAREKIRKEEADKLAAAAPAPTPAAISAPVAAPAPTVVSFGGARRTVAAPLPTPATPPTLKLGDISARLAPISLTAEGLKSLGFVHSAQQGATKLFHERQFPLICAALVQHIESVQAQQAA
jgi:putative phage-type endonuclease